MAARLPYLFSRYCCHSTSAPCSSSCSSGRVRAKATQASVLPRAEQAGLRVSAGIWLTHDAARYADCAELGADFLVLSGAGSKEGAAPDPDSAAQAALKAARQGEQAAAKEEGEGEGEAKNKTKTKTTSSSR